MSVQTLYDLRHVDPWRKMAVERQFQKLLKEPQEPNLPATLQYLEENLTFELVPSSLNRAILDTERLELYAHLEGGTYAMALTKMLWEEHAKLSEEMETELDQDNPGESLFSRIISSSNVQFSG